MGEIKRWLAAALFLAAGNLLCAAVMEAVGQNDLKTVWGNASMARNDDGSIRLISNNAEGAAALIAGTPEVPENSECRFSFEVRGNVRFQTMLRFADGAKTKRVDIVMPTPLTGEWQKIERSFTVPPGFRKILLDFLIWKQTGYAEIRNYKLEIPLKRKDVTVFRSDFQRGALIRNRYHSRIPSFWWEFRSPDAPKGEIGGLDSAVSLIPKGKSLRIPAVPRGWWGWVSFDTALKKPFRPMTLRFRYRLSKDFSGNEIQARLVFRNKEKEDFSQIIWRLPVSEKEKWLTAEYRVEESRIPAKAVGFRIALQPGRIGSEPVRGSVWFGEAAVTLPENDGAFARIRCDRDLCWYSLGETVRFRALGELPPECTAVTGKIRRSDRTPVAELRIPGAEMKRSGWSWTPKEPGYYEVEFFAETPSGPIPLAEEFAERASDGRIGLFDNATLSFAVIDRDGPAQHSRLFGYQTFFHPWQIQRFGDRDFRIARTVGGRYLRFGATWSLLEKEKGKFDWKLLDDYVDLCSRSGLKPLLGLSSTPRWASSHPEDDRWVICTWGYSAWAPKEFRDWENFIEQAVSRYRKQVSDWEIWNEPNLPGVSCFWHDSPENFVRLLKSAYRTIKRFQPDSNVLGSGYSDRYLTFYEQIIRLGAGEAFDTLSIHGLNCTIPAFHAIDRKYNSPKHRVFNSEWHWGLLRYDYPTMKASEEELALGMMKGLFSMLSNGVEGISIFEPVNMAEKETLTLHAAGGDPLTHTSGIFRGKPRLQPRLVAVILANLSRRYLTGIPTVQSMARAGAFKTVLLRTADGPYLAFWQEGKAPVRLSPVLESVVAGSRIGDWEGRSVEAGAKGTFAPNVVYFARAPRIPAGWKNDPSVLQEEARSRELRHDTAGVYSRKPILTEEGRPIPENIRWNSNFSVFHWGGIPAGFAKPTRFAAAVTDSRFQLIVETRDELHHPVLEGRDLWRGDSLEFSVDGRGKGLNADCVGFSAAKIPGGKNLMFKGHVPTVVGDCPTVWTPASMPVETGRCEIFVQPAEKKTVYRIDLPLTELFPYLPKSGEPLRFSLLVNENNGKERIAALCWGGGIVGGKDAAKYGDLKAE